MGGMSVSGLPSSSPLQDQTALNIRERAGGRKQKLINAGAVCPFVCPLGPLLCPFSPADSGTPHGKNGRSCVLPLIYTVSCRHSTIRLVEWGTLVGASVGRLQNPQNGSEWGF